MSMKFTKIKVCIFCEQECDKHNYWHEDCRTKFIDESN